MLIPVNILRLLYLEVLALVWSLDWIVNYLQPEQNAGHWLAAATGAFIIRFVRPNLPVKEWIFGLIVGYMAAILFSPDIIDAGGIGFIKRPEGIYGTVALLTDLVIQVLAFVVRLSQKVGGTIYDNPGEAFDGTLERVEKVTSLWVRIKTPLLDIINQITKKTP